MRRRNWRPSIALALACVALAWLAARPWLETAEPPAVEAVTSEAAMEAPLTVPAVIGARSEYAETVERPLFLAARTSIAADSVRSVDEAVPQLVLGGWRLTGVVIAPGRRIALLTPRGGGQTVRLAPGEEIDGWLIEAVSAEGVTLRAGPLVERIPLDRPRR